MTRHDFRDDEGFRLGFRVMRIALAACAATLLLQGVLDWCAPQGLPLAIHATALACAGPVVAPHAR